MSVILTMEIMAIIALILMVLITALAMLERCLATMLYIYYTS